VRPGAALYGLAPVAGAPNPMTPVVDLRGRIVQVRHVEAGEPVGYGCHWRAPARSTIATVAVGYADGWLRSLGTRGKGWIGGREMPMVGVVSMDTITFDASGADATLLVEGAPVELIGPSMPADTVAALAGTIGYEILTGLGHRYHRNYV
jgi:alanine racemase